MSFELIVGLALMGGLLILLLGGIPVAWAFGVMAGMGLLLVNQPLSQFANTAWHSLYSFTLTAIPLFVLMGSVLGQTGINEKLFKGVEAWLGWIPGGLACTTLGANGVFAAMCGSNLAAVGTFGKIAFPPMERRGYDPGLALGSIAMGGLLAPVIPPSLILIVYGVWGQLSILDLFAAALVPGIMLLLLMMCSVVVMVKLNPSLAPRGPKFSWRERLVGLKEIGPSALIVLGVLGSMFGGIMTPTEAASMGAFLSIVLGLAYRELNLAKLKASLMDTVRVSSMIFILMALVMPFIHVVNLLGLNRYATEYFLALPIGKYGIMVLFLVMYLIMGGFFDPWSMMFLTMSFVLPVVIELGFNPIWWGVVYVVQAEQSNVTPPYGLNLFVLKAAVHHPIGTIIRGSMPFLIPFYISVGLMIAFPQIVLFLPQLLYG